MNFNFYDYNLESEARKLVYDDLLFVEFRCLPGEVDNIVWSHYGYIAYVQSGKKTWISTSKEFKVNKGEAIYCKKGGNITHSFYEDQFCALIFFFPEKFVRETILEFQQELPEVKPLADDSLLRMNVDVYLKGFFDSVMTYFHHPENPSRHLLKLKFKELILQVLTTKTNPELAATFIAMARQNQAGLKQLMLENCLYHLKLDDYARLCNRSLSTFKRDFRKTFGMSPGKWIYEQRLAHARIRLINTEESIGDIAFHCGFETTTNFITCFKKRFGSPPQQYRRKTSLV